MGLQSTLGTIFGKGLVAKGNDADFNEAIYDGFQNTGWEFGDADSDLQTSGGRFVPFVAALHSFRFDVMGYESSRPEEWGAFFYGAFNLSMAQVIADNITDGVLILSHEVEGNGTSYFFITPGKAEEVDVVDAILGMKGLTR